MTIRLVPCEPPDGWPDEHCPCWVDGDRCCWCGKQDPDDTYCEEL